jgi:ribonuclease D
VTDDRDATEPAVAPEPQPEPEPPLLREPVEGIPPVTETANDLAAAVAALQTGTGPVAVDAERASGYRYGQRAYLVQLRREGAGTFLIDPTRIPDLTPLRTALAQMPWILHAASQDLPCLDEIGLRPPQLFDTELAGRLLGLPKVGLAALTQTLLGVTLAKEHSAVDWSTRPLPQPWLAYAALDVELLLPLADELQRMLADAGKSEWARQEFAHLVENPRTPPRRDPWRRTSGIHTVRGRRGLGIVRELWLERDRLAAELDTAPGRVLPDLAISAAARAGAGTLEDLTELADFRKRGAKRHLDRWAAAVGRAGVLPEADLPPVTLIDGPPPPRAWKDKAPEAGARLDAARRVVNDRAQALNLPQENLLPPDAVRRLCWEPPPVLDADSVSAQLLGSGARQWQVDLTADELAVALTDALAAQVTDQ